MTIIGTSASGALRRTALIAGLALGLAACTPIVRNHGYIPLQEDLANIVVGVDTRNSVADLIGTPTSAGMTADRGYYYVSSSFRHFGPLAPKEVSREVLAITFDSRGVVSDIARYGLEDGRVVALSRRVTEDNVRDTTLIRQLLGNLGQINASQFLGP